MVTMPEVNHPVAVLAAVLAGVGLIVTQAWRAVLCVWPRSLRVHAEEPADVMVVPGVLEETWSALLGLRFRPVGTHSEHPVLRRTSVVYDALLDEQHTWASVDSVEGRVRLTFFTRTETGFVLTTNQRRAARERGGVFIGALEGATPERLLKAHLRRVQSAVASGTTVEERVALAREWLAGAGAWDVRMTHVIGLLWTLGGLGFLGSALMTVW